MAIDYTKRASIRQLPPRAPTPAADRSVGGQPRKVTLTKGAPTGLADQVRRQRRYRQGQPELVGRPTRRRSGGFLAKMKRAAASAKGSTSTSAACTNWPTAARASSRRWATPSARWTRRRGSCWTATTAPARSPAARTCRSTWPARPVPPGADLRDDLRGRAELGRRRRCRHPVPRPRARRSRSASTHRNNARSARIALLQNTGQRNHCHPRDHYINGSRGELDRVYGWA